MERIEVKENTVSAFLRVRGDWLLNEREILIVREVQYQHVQPTEEEVKEHEQALPPNTTVFKRRKHNKQAPKEKFYITKLEVNGYNADGKFVGTYNDEWCARIIGMQDDEHSTFNIYKLRKAWEKMQEQIDALTQYEKELEMEKEAEKSEAKDQES